MKKMIIIMVTIFIGSMIGLFTIYINPAAYKVYLNSLFWSLGGTSLGFILGSYQRNKATRQISKKVFYQVTTICITTVLASIIAFIALKEISFIAILIFNILGLITAIWMLAKHPKLDNDFLKK